MSEANQRIAILCTSVFAIGWLRLYFGYESWDMSKDITSLVVITGGAGIAAKFLGKQE